MTWDEHADGWDDNPAVRAYAEAAFQSLTELCAERDFGLAGARVCDFGCGTGLLTERLAPACGEVFAIDTSAKMVKVLDDKLQRLGISNVQTASADIAELIQSAALSLKEPFDLVVCSSVCAFVDDYPATVRQLAGLLGPKGLFVQWDWELDPGSDDGFGLTRRQITDALSQAGLGAIEVDPSFETTAEGKVMRPLRGVGQAAHEPSPV